MITENAASEVPPVLRICRVRQPPERAFALFTDEIGAWWPLPTHGVFGEWSGGLTFRDGRLIEQSIAGEQSVWGEVLDWTPPDSLSFTWHPGRGGEPASRVVVTFEADGEGTRVLLEHTGWEAFGEDGPGRRRSYVGPNAWGYVLDHFADLAEPRPDPVDVTALAAAYDEFFAEAELGGFGPPPEGEWDAEQTVAHVALSDAGIVAVTQGLIHRQGRTFENQTCQDRTVLADRIVAAGGMPGLIEACREQAATLMAVVGRLSPEQLATEVPCRLTHDGQVVLDGPRPWGSIAVQTQAAGHLPAHTRQLRDLRAERVATAD